MTTSTRPMTRTATRVVVVLAVLCALVGLLAPAGTPWLPRAMAATNTLVLDKHAGEGTTAGQPLAGIDFKVNRILDVDATSAEQLNALVAEQPAVLTDDPGHPLGTDVLLTTDADGRATATGLPDGVYLVRELPSRTGDVAWSVATPFLVALPTSSGNRSPVVSLKDQPLGVDVTLSPTEVVPGEQVRVTITGQVPAPDVRGRLYRYVMVTRLDDNLPFEQMGQVSITGAFGTQLLDPATDWTWRVDAATGAVAVELTPAGLAKLAALRAGHPEVRVVVTMVARAASGAAGRQLTVMTNLFTDGWPVPADLALAWADGAAVAEATVRVVPAACPDCAPSPSQAPAPSATPCPTCTLAPATPCPTCQAPAPAVPSAAPRAPWRGLAGTGAVVTPLALAVGAGLVGTGLWLLLARRRRDDDELGQDTPGARQTATTDHTTTSTDEGRAR